MVEPIMPECHVDTNLIETLVPPHTRYNHQHGCTEVAKRMKTNYRNDFALGIIDKDKKGIEYLDEFDKINEITDELILWKHKQHHHYLIQICPAVESWILKRSNELNLDLTEFGLKNSLKELKDITKTIVSQKDERLKKLFKVLKSSNNEVVLKLTVWITYLRDNKFNVDTKQL